MPRIHASDLAGLFAWMVDAQEFLPLTEEAKRAVDQLVIWQSDFQMIKERRGEEKPIAGWLLPDPKPTQQ